ncbi:MAG TPA: hydrogen peroxide-inducible genes activator, partial [Alteromonas macleodii]|nr:hydrogen peroxide-inducible genes activator [Alteromonas macleodii]
IADMPIERQHSLAWRNTAPGRKTFREISIIIKEIIETRLSDAVTIVSAAPSPLPKR